MKEKDIKIKAVELCVNTRVKIDEFLYENNIKATQKSIEKLSKDLILNQIDELQKHSAKVTIVVSNKKWMMFDYWQQIKEEIQEL